MKFAKEYAANGSLSAASFVEKSFVVVRRGSLLCIVVHFAKISPKQSTTSKTDVPKGGEAGRIS